jgi:hypothetical protein
MAGRERVDAHRHRLLPALALSLTGVALMACGGASSGQTDSAKAARVPPVVRDASLDSLKDAADAVAAASAESYEITDVSNPGTITGRIRMDRIPARHTVKLTGGDSAACGSTLGDGSVAGYGRDLENALVWVSDIHRGQGLPVLRRAPLQIRRCAFVPRVLAVPQGTTINLQSRDDTEHHTQFFSVSADSLLSRLLTVDRWAVVPNARIGADPGLVEVRLTPVPSARGFVAVFGNPYFDVTDRYGSFRIAGLPPGTYHLRIWHERGGAPLDRVITVTAGRATTFDTTLVLH